MIFAFSTDDRALRAFATEAEATAHAEGIDVENGVWLFFDRTGAALEAAFTHPNERSKLSIRSGKYHLRPAASPDVESLNQILPRVVSVEGEFASVDSVRHFLTKALRSTPR